MRTLYELARQDVFDSRDAEERIVEIEEAIAYDYPAEEDYASERVEIEEELSALKTLRADAGSEWHYGMTFIAAEHFVTYAQELAEDIGAVNEDGAWPTYHIDWESAAEDLKQDYSAFEIDGWIFYARD